MKKFFLSTLIILLSGLAFAACKKPLEQKIDEKTEQGLIKQEKSGGFSGSIKDLVGMGKAQKCTWTVEGQGSSTVYVNGKNTRVEVTMPAMEDHPAQQMVTVADDNWGYSWNTATKQGMKMNVKELEEDAATEETTDAEDDTDDYQTMIGEDFEFKCEPWKVDQDMFTPPTDVEFADLNVMMEEIKEDMEGMKKMCDMLSGEDKEECLKSFE